MRIAKAKLFNNGRSQAVRLPVEFRFNTTEVYIRRDNNTGDIILWERPGNWDKLFALIDGIPQKEREKFMPDRDTRPPERGNVLE